MSDGGIQGVMPKWGNPGKCPTGEFREMSEEGTFSGNFRVETSREGRPRENVRRGNNAQGIFEGRKCRGENVLHRRHGGLLGRTGSLPLFAVRILSGNRCVCLPACGQQRLSGGHETDHTHRGSSRERRSSAGRYWQKFDSARFMS